MAQDEARCLCLSLSPEPWDSQRLRQFEHQSKTSCRRHHARRVGRGGDDRGADRVADPVANRGDSVARHYAQGVHAPPRGRHRPRRRHDRSLRRDSRRQRHAVDPRVRRHEPARQQHHPVRGDCRPPGHRVRAQHSVARRPADAAARTPEGHRRRQGDLSTAVRLPGAPLRASRGDPGRRRPLRRDSHRRVDAVRAR